MIINYIQKKRNKNIWIHVFTLIPLLFIYSLALMYFPKNQWVLHIILFVSLIILVISFSIGMYKIKNSLKHKKVRMHQEFFMIPYPQKFIDAMVEVGEFFKSYRHHKHLIPEYFIEFREGRTLYLYPLIQNITDESYTILKINKFELALVLDENNKKRILHLGNAALID